MSAVVQRLLQYYNEFKDEDSGWVLSDIRMDLERALAALTPEERRFVDLVFLTQEPGLRTGGKGRPLGGTTQTLLASQLAITNFSSTAQRAEITRRKQAICAKLASVMGEEYQ